MDHVCYILRDVVITLLYLQTRVPVTLPWWTVSRRPAEPADPPPWRAVVAAVAHSRELNFYRGVVEAK